MKISQFNIYNNIKDNKYLVFNTLTTSLVVLNDDVYKKIFVSNIFDNDDAEKLFSMGFLVNDDTNEYETIKNNRNVIINGGKEYITDFTILLTTNCNARCSYCFENGIAHNTLSFEQCDQIIEFIYEKSNKNNINIWWFGGEPLLAFDKLKYINDGLIKKGLIISSRITTNGSLITDDVINYSIKNGINSFQITIDDIGDNYNKIKNYCNIHDAFPVVIDNIKKLLETTITVIIRINFKLGELSKAKIIREEIKGLIGNKARIYFAPLSLHNQESVKRGSIEESDYLELLELSKDDASFLSKNKYAIIPDSAGLYKYHLLPIGLSCVVEKEDNIVINADGKLYKCHRLVGHEEQSCGDIFNGIDMESNGYKLFVNPNIEQDECKHCNILPLCHGCCKANRILYSECDNCSPLKDIIKDVIINYVIKK